MLQFTPISYAVVTFGLFMMSVRLFSYFFGDETVNENIHMYSIIASSCIGIIVFVPYYYGIYEIVIPDDQYSRKSKKLGYFEKAIDRY